MKSYFQEGILKGIALKRVWAEPNVPPQEPFALDTAERQEPSYECVGSHP